MPGCTCHCEVPTRHYKKLSWQLLFSFHKTEKANVETAFRDLDRSVITSALVVCVFFKRKKCVLFTNIAREVYRALL